MANRPFSLRLSDELVSEIQKQYPDFGGAEQGGEGINSKALRKVIERGLENDPQQALGHELAEIREQLRDIQREMESINRSFSTVLQVVLRNAGKFAPTDVEATIRKLKEGGKLV